MERRERTAPQALTEGQVMREIIAMIRNSNQRQVALECNLKPQQLNRLLQGSTSLSPVMAAKLGFEVRYIRRVKSTTTSRKRREV